MVRPNDIFESVRQVLRHDWDPIGISDAAEAQDEYDDYGRQISRMLAADVSVMDLSKYLLDIEVGSMSLAGDKVRADAVARKLWRIGHP